ncbi:hypothetical protein E2C06_31440 [Dankookia rubra]|uniref:Uncharacterized protein n=1 Tax=Dankookia rubra TaxID=1442381 RepID=A0A4R5Q7V9_9PROT|nr:hypothetical protein [Dankookia rubra]TDH58663.1 hypothetical protein E2C06_31440 [Dankookia rubra]
MGAGVCGVLASRAADVRKPIAAAALAGLVVLGAVRNLPVFLAGPVLATDGRSLAGTLVWLRPAPGGTRIEVLGGSGAFRRGEALEYHGSSAERLVRGRG